MSSSLTEDQSNAVRQWAEEGADMAAIQRRLDEEFEVQLTFMDTRFLIADLGIELVEEEEEEADEEEPEVEAPANEAEGEPAADESAEDLAQPAQPEPEMEGEATEEPDNGTATAAVTISELQRPGMMISGSVTFDGGDKAEWYLDQSGQLGMNPESEEFRPNPQQMRVFQMELQKAAQQKGF
jgi:hypothetical protein